MKDFEVSRYFVTRLRVDPELRAQWNRVCVKSRKMAQDNNKSQARQLLVQFFSRLGLSVDYRNIPQAMQSFNEQDGIPDKSALRAVEDIQRIGDLRRDFLNLVRIQSNPPLSDSTINRPNSQQGDPYEVFLTRNGYQNTNGGKLAIALGNSVGRNLSRWSGIYGNSTMSSSGRKCRGEGLIIYSTNDGAEMRTIIALGAAKIIAPKYDDETATLTWEAGDINETSGTLEFSYPRMRENSTKDGPTATGVIVYPQDSVKVGGGPVDFYAYPGNPDSLPPSVREDELRRNAESVRILTSLAKMATFVNYRYQSSTAVSES